MSKKEEAAVEAAATAEAVAETPAEVKAAAALVKKAPKSITRTLSDGKDQLQFIGLIRKDGSVDSHIVHRINKPDGKLEKSTRGESKKHATVEDAAKSFEAGVAVAVKQGWQERKAGASAGFRAKPDSFSISNLPKPAGK